MVSDEERVPGGLYAALERLCSTERLLVALDFDGTMAPLVPQPERARPLPATVEAFSAVAGLPRTWTALISGRPLSSLRVAAQPGPGTWMIGSHGAEQWLGDDSSELQLTVDQEELLRDVVAVFERVAAEYSGAAVEVKPAGAALHTRVCPDRRDAESARSRARALAEPLGVYLKDGKDVLEAAVVRADKGQGVGVLREASAATAVFFAGDDVTDEDAFAALTPDDVGLKVGVGPTRASYRVPSIAQVSVVVEFIFRARRAVVNGR